MIPVTTPELLRVAVAVRPLPVPPLESCTSTVGATV